MATGFEKLGIGPDNPPKLILDFCWNHEGSIGRVRQMLQALRDNLTPEQYSLIIPKFQAGRDLPWDRPMYRGVKKMCEGEFGLPFLCTAFDYKAVDMLTSIGVDAIKIGSAEACDMDFIEYAYSFGPVIVSTGGMTFEEVHGVWWRCPGALLMHCVSQYPARAEDLCLGFLDSRIIPDHSFNESAHKTARFIHGYSSHYPHIEDAIFAMPLGARVIEKHFTIGGGPDHAVSIDVLQARVICESALLWRKMRGYTKSQETLEAERALLKPFRDAFYGKWHNHQAGQDKGQAEMASYHAGHDHCE